MAVKEMDGKTLAHLFIAGANNLSQHAKVVDALNVFPVPDGDTGTNMNLTITSGAQEVKKFHGDHAGELAAAFAKGLLMGARGNSGVILSQLFRGFSKSVEGRRAFTALDFAEALTQGVETAYKAVMKPVEGTILTVAKDSANAAKKAVKHTDDLVSLMEIIVTEAKQSLQRTPDLLPVLKEVGVVDSGGQGLVYIYEGFLAAVKGEPLKEGIHEVPSMDNLIKVEHHQNAQSHLATEDIEFGYCTEVMVRFESDKLSTYPFNEPAFRDELSEWGDSLLVVSDEDLLKVHIHAEFPGEVLTRAQRYGSLIHTKIENMREQHTHLLEESKQAFPDEEKKPLSELGIVTVSMGDGIAKLFQSLGAGVVIPGGQTMNPSTEDIVKAIEEVHAKNVLVLPNNGNIILAAQQAADVADVNVKVVPSKTVPQGLAALLSFNPSSSLEENANVMAETMAHVKSGQVTYAVRDTSIEGLEIKKGHFMGILEKEIVTSGEDMLDVTKRLLEQMIDEDSEIVTVIQGADATNEQTEELIQFIEQSYPEVEVDEQIGDQPLYAYLFAVE
ncbi:DAK2 domain-containing protein [Halalkalibacterium halodurans]|uniref:DAK2 domain-containing protein n=1 Tax=Halalkalibacterium halodurans TaxID=86665 RepID=UPI002E1C58CF|nr:DAK2 domain-containing protein [Halalkalibacterium halodurans]